MLLILTGSKSPLGVMAYTISPGLGIGVSEVRGFGAGFRGFGINLRGLEIYPPVLLSYLDHIPALLDKQFAGGGEVVQLCNYLQDFVFSFFREHLLVSVQIADLDAKKPDWFRK